MRALQVAVRTQNEKAVRALLDANHPACTSDDGPIPPLVMAAKRYNWAITELLWYSRTHRVDCKCAALVCVLPAMMSRAVFANKMVRELLDAGCSPNAKCHYGSTPLHDALRAVDVFELLLNAGANPNVANAMGTYPLHLAVDLVLNDSANLNVANVAGTYPLHLAVDMLPRFSPLRLVRMLIAAGANLDCRDNRGATPLATAVRRKRVDVARLLLQAGASVDCANFYKQTPLMQAIEVRAGLEMVNVLLEAGADPNLFDSCDRSPLFEAILVSDIDIARTLLEHGADPHSMSPGNLTLLEYAFDQQGPDFGELLLSSHLSF